MVGGGNTPLWPMPLGSFPIPLPMSYPLLKVAGRFAVCLRGASGGLEVGSSSVCVAVTGALPTWPTFKAAIRAWMDCAWEGSPAIVTIEACQDRFLGRTLTSAYVLCQLFAGVGAIRNDEAVYARILGEYPAISCISYPLMTCRLGSPNHHPATVKHTITVYCYYGLTPLCKCIPFPASGYWNTWTGENFMKQKLLRY